MEQKNPDTKSETVIPHESLLTKNIVLILVISAVVITIIGYIAYTFSTTSQRAESDTLTPTGAVVSPGQENDPSVDQREPGPGGMNQVNEFGGCVRAGCSGQLCVNSQAQDSNDGFITTCEFRAEYSCLDSARCEPQPDGECGWTQTEESQQCLDSLEGGQEDPLLNAQ